MTDGTSRDQAAGVDPYLTALLVCDQVIEEAGTGAKTLISIFSGIVVPTLPASRTIAVYARITDAQGLYFFRLDFAHLSTGRVLGQIQFPPRSIPDRLQYYDLIVPATVALDEPGLYEFSLHANENYLGRVAFAVRPGQSIGG